MIAWANHRSFRREVDEICKTPDAAEVEAVEARQARKRQTGTPLLTHKYWTGRLERHGLGADFKDLPAFAFSSDVL